MTKIFEILSTKPHNPHYLKRYIKFIKHCQTRVSNETYFETHHIAPRASDLFPELDNDPANYASLTAREHILAHVILWKTYGGSQATALHCMINNFNSDTNFYLKDRVVPTAIKIRYLATLREDAGIRKGEIHKNRSTFKDAEGTKYYLYTDDPLIDQLGLVGNNTGKVFSEESRLNLRGKRVHTLYDNSARRTIQLKGKNNTEVQKYIDSGWSFLKDEQWEDEDREEARQHQIVAARKANQGTPMYLPSGEYYGRVKKGNPHIDELKLTHKRSEKQSQCAYTSAKAAQLANIGSKIYNNGLVEKKFKSGDTIADEWKLGRLPRSESHKANMKKNGMGGTTTWNDGSRSYRLRPDQVPEPHWVRGMLRYIK
jgi:hypothetical protein